MNKKFSIGCDIGGSHISCGIVDIVSGYIVDDSMVSVNVDNSSSSEIIIKAWIKAIVLCKKQLPEEGELLGIGIAIPGPFDYENGIGLYDNSNQKFVHLKDVNLRNALSESLDLESKKIKFINDATAFALGSYWYGSGKGHKKLVSITLGTGFGSSFIEEGKSIDTGATVPDSGCLWHLPYKDGIADDYFSTRWFIERYNILYNLKVEGVKTIAEMADEGDRNALELFNLFGDNLADCLAPHLKNFKAEVVILGGNIAEAYTHFKPNLLKGLQNRKVKSDIKISRLKESAAMLGAATLFKE
jgi:glucokinase